MAKIFSNDFKAQLPFSCSSIVLKCWHLYQALIAFAFIISFGVELASYIELTNIGAIFYATSPVGKEEKTAMEIAVHNFNISLFMNPTNPGRDPLMAAITAAKPDKEMNTWEEGASVAAIGNHGHGSVLSYATPFTPSTLSSLGQPFLAKLTINDFDQRKCSAVIIHVYSWSRVIPSLEEEEYVVFILNYRARVSSILTFQPLEPNIIDIERLKKANSEIKFEKQHIENVSNKYKYEGEIWSINRAAAFLELPPGKVFPSQHIKQFTATTPTYSFGGLGFVFKKGSPIATDVSRAILDLYEDGTLKSLEGNSFAYSSNSYRVDYSRSLAIEGFWGIYLIFGATSTVYLLFFLINLIKSYCWEQDENEDNLPPC